MNTPRLRSKPWHRFAAPASFAAFITAAAFAQPAPAPKADSELAPASADEPVVLSPYEVVAETKGYYSANTMSGTRLNTKLEDLASSITVVTKQQMEDFAMLDINDVFLYTANTEGTGTYTDAPVDRNGQLTDNSQGNPTQANRVRGIAPANISYANYEMMGRTPIDPLIIDGVEVSRGPNANVFGLGNPSGTVNQVAASADLTKTRSRVELRADNTDGWRTTLDHNQVLLKNKLALRLNGGRQHDGFERKPSGFDTDRFDAIVKYRPFKYTTLTASYLYYKGEGNRPNNTPPRDYVSAWIESGRPGWDPVTGLITLNGRTFGQGSTDTVTTTTPFTDANLPAYFNRLGGAFQRSNIFVDQSGITYWTTPTNNTGVSPNANAGTIRFLGPSSSVRFKSSVAGRFDNQPLFTTTPTIADESIYDWSSVNLSAIDYFYDKTETYFVQLEQILLNTQRHMIAAQAGFFREDADRYRHTPASNSGISGQTGQLWVDVNLKNLDGTTNPNFGRPYLGIIEPRDTNQPARWDTYRAQLAYRLDLTHESNWLKWLGMHQFSVYDDYKYHVNRTYSYRDVMTNDATWAQVGVGGIVSNYARANQSSVTGGPQAGPNVMRGFYRYYVGDATNSNVDYAPTTYTNGQYPFVWGTTNNWRRETATLGRLPTTDGTGGGANLKQIIKTSGVVMQNHFLDNAIATTFGIRQDKVFSKAGATPQQMMNNNTEFNYDIINSWAPNWRYNSGRTKTAGIVARPFRDLAFVQRGAAKGSFFAEVLSGLSLTYNKSDNFLVAPPAIDLFQNQLPNTTGKGKDYGFWLNMADGKLVIRFNHYENEQFNARNGDANTIAQRVLRRDLDVSTEPYRLMLVATNWVTQKNPGWTADQVRTEVLKQIGYTQGDVDVLSDAFRNGTLAATNDISGKGNELEINYNPSRYWTIAASVTDTRSTNSNVSTSIQEWIDKRMPFWTTIVDQSDGALWWTKNYGGSQTSAQNYLSFIDAPYAVIRESQGKSLPSVRRYGAKISTNFQLAAITDNPIAKKFAVGGAVRWEDRGSIGYYGVNWEQNIASGTPITRLDVDNPIWDKAHYYFDGFVSYKTKLFADRVPTQVKLNVRNIQEGGRLQAIGAFPDGTPNAYRIVDPRTFILTVTFDL